MSFHSWLQNLRSALVSSRGQRQRRPRGSLRAAMYQPYFETLENRRLLTFAPVVSYPAGIEHRYLPLARFLGYLRYLVLLDHETQADRVQALLPELVALARR